MDTVIMGRYKTPLKNSGPVVIKTDADYNRAYDELAELESRMGKMEKGELRRALELRQALDAFVDGKRSI